MPFSKKPKKIIAKTLLVEKKLCESLEEAEALIYAGQVFANEQRVQKPGQQLFENVSLRVNKKEFVSRGALKLQDAIRAFNLLNDFMNKTVLDVGASTGGFTDYVLKLGAHRVIAVDVGFNQLDWSLKTNPKVVSLEKTDIRNFDPIPYTPFHWILADISFNSLEAMAPFLLKLGSQETRFLLLIKPQFELSGNEIPSGGVVTDETLWNKAIDKVISSLEKLGGRNFQIHKSTIKGRSGNQEFFIYFNGVDNQTQHVQLSP